MRGRLAGQEGVGRGRLAGQLGVGRGRLTGHGGVWHETLAGQGGVGCGDPHNKEQKGVEDSQDSEE